MVIAIYVFNVYAARWMPRIQSLLLVLHVLGFVVVTATLWAMAPRPTAQNVFYGVYDYGWMAEYGC